MPRDALYQPDMAAKIIEKFTPKLVAAVSDCVRSVADACLANGLISSDTSNDILESIVTSEDKTRKLLKSIKNCIEVDGISFDIFLRILDENLPERSRARLLTDMRAELTREQAQAATSESRSMERTTLVPLSGHMHGTMASVNHGQLSVPHARDVSCLLHQEQNPFFGKLEESIREHERTIAEKKLLKEKLEENERLKANLTSIRQTLLFLSNTSSDERREDTGDNYLDTNTFMPEADVSQLKEKIKMLEQKSIELGMAIRRYRCAIDIKGDEITYKLMAAQKKLEFQYEQRFQELKKSMMNYSGSEREPQQYGSYYESYSREVSDDDVPISKRKKTESDSDTKADDVDIPVHCKFIISIIIMPLILCGIPNFN